MTKKERYRAFVDYFFRAMPEAATELVYQNPFELLIAVILSAQCTDKRINQVTPALFARFRNPYKLAKADVTEVFDYIKSVSYPQSKAKYLVGMAQKLINQFEGKIPDQLEDLQSLPGVGRKTANVILSVVYQKPAMPVDTHVMRVSKRLGLVRARSTTPLAIERELVHYLPEKYVTRAHHWLILHGRYTCLARAPKCGICPITQLCAYFQQNKKNSQVT